MMQPIIFVTSNENKFREAGRILNIDLAQKSLDLEEIQEMDLRKIIEHKAKQAYDVFKQPVVVEDAGLYIDAWSGFPGPFIKWIQKTMGYETMGSLLSKKDRSARWVVMVGYYDGERIHYFEGCIDGAIPRKPSGSHGWGFDAWFVPQGSRQTYAAMGPEEKMNYSARQQAFTKLKEYFTV